MEGAVSRGGRTAGGGGTQETPPELFSAVDRLFHFTLDVCAIRSNRKVERYFGPPGETDPAVGLQGVDGLVQSWAGEVWWMNPPYTRGEIEKWVQKAAYEIEFGDNWGVALIPGDMGTGWWRDWVAPYALIHPIQGRVKFVGYSWPNTVASVLALYVPQFNGRGVAPSGSRR